MFLYVHVSLCYFVSPQTVNTVGGKKKPATVFGLVNAVSGRCPPPVVLVTCASSGVQLG